MQRPIMNSLPIIPHVFQVKLLWAASDLPKVATNDLYFKDLTNVAAETDVQTALAANVTAGMWTAVYNNAVVTNTIITRLDGVSAGVQFATGGGAKWTGGSGTDPILQGAQVVTLRTLIGGRSYRGRIYLPWISEAAQSKGLVTPATVTSMQTAWNTFRGAMETAQYSPQVVSALHSTSQQVSAFVVRGNLTTQRRRALRSI